MSEPTIQYVQIKSRQYDCERCNVTHDYHDADQLYHAHQGLQVKRWIVEEVDAPEQRTIPSAS